MTHRLRCFGRLAIEDEGGERVQLRSRKHLALLVYLAAHPDRRHERGRLAGLFWDTEPDLARHSLSQALYDLGKHLPDLDLDRTNREVGLGPTGFDYDGRAFEEAVREDRLDEAVRLYDGPFAPDLETVGGPDFERWVERERTRFRSLAEKALLRQVAACADAGRWGEMVVAGNRLVDMNPLSEEAHRAVMKGLWLRGDRSAALAHFQEHEDFLEKELPGGVSAETRELIEKIRSAERRGGGQTVRERPRPEMVGREEEFRVLKDALADVMEGESRFIVIRGEAGIGKTRLLEEFAEVAALEDVRLLESRCYAAESDVPYGPIVDGLKELVEEFAESPGAEETKFYQLGHLFPEVFGKPERKKVYMPATAGTYRMAEEFVTLLRYSADEFGPLVWIIDDTHWADHASQSLLNYAVSRCEEAPLLVIQALRPFESQKDGNKPISGPAPWSIIDVSPLSEKSLKELVQSTGTADNSTNIIAKITSLSGGNPFFALELLEQSKHYEHHKKSEIKKTLTGKIERALSVRLEQRTQQETQLLEGLAVAGRHATPRLLAAITGLDLPSVAAVSSSLYRAGIIYDESGNLSFRHDLFTRFVYDHMGGVTRKTLHLLAAEYLENSAKDHVPAALARHYAQTEEDAKAQEYALEAASEAADRYAHEEAIKFLNVVLDRANTKDTTNKALYLKAKAEHALGHLEAASATMEQALKSETMSPQERVELLLLRGDALVERGKWDEAQKVLGSLNENHVSSIRDGPAKLAWAKYLLLKAAVRSNNRSAAETLLEADGQIDNKTGEVVALPLTRTENLDLDVWVLKHLQFVAYNAFYGRIQDAIEAISKIEAAAPKLPYDLRRHVYSVGGMVANRAGNWEKGIALNRRMIEDAEQFNDTLTLSMTQVNLAVLEMERGNIIEAVRLTRKSLEGTSVDRGSNYTAIIRTNCADQHFFRENYPAATREYKEAIKLSKQYGFGYLMPELYAAYGLSLLAEGNIEEAMAIAPKVEPKETSLEAVQDRYKIYWYQAIQMVVENNGNPAKILRGAAEKESSTDIPSARRLEWLADLFSAAYSHSAHSAAATHSPAPEDAQGLKEINLGWFAYHSRRWMMRVRSHVG